MFVFQSEIKDASSLNIMRTKKELWANCEFIRVRVNTHDFLTGRYGIKGAKHLATG